MAKRRLTAHDNDQTYHIDVAEGTNLRHALLQHGLSPYAPLTRRLNCGGNGICATCGVWICSGEPAPTHWHDKLAQRFGYSRLSCQIEVHADMEIRLDREKKVWGKPKKRRGTNAE